MAVLSSPGAALGSGLLVQDCPGARKVREEMAGKLAELEEEREKLIALMKVRSQRLQMLENGSASVATSTAMPVT